MRFFYILLILLPLGSLAQTNSVSKGDALGINYMGGRILIHTPKIHDTEPPYSSGIELSYKRQTTGKKDWHQRFGFPEAGVNIFLSMNGSKQLGNAIGLYPSIQFRIMTFEKFYWYLKFGGGIGLASKHWQRTPPQDSMDNIIGSTVNNFTMFQTGISYTLNKHWTAEAGLHFYHLSNAAARTPNYGINTYGLHVGANYHFKSVVTQFEKRKLKHHKNYLNLSLFSSIAFAEDKTPDGPMYPVFTGSMAVYKMYRNKSRIIIGSDAIYSTKLRALIHDTYQMKGDKFISPWQFTAFLGHEFLFGKIGFPLIAGAYMNRPVGGEKFYQKLGINYHFAHRKEGTFKDAYLSLLLKTHYIQAQYAELGFGFFL